MEYIYIYIYIYIYTDVQWKFKINYKINKIQIICKTKELQEKPKNEE